MSFESFYGGRQGASFVIVEHFDGIDIPENSVYKNTYYAVNEDKIVKYPFIQKTEKNFLNYDWTCITLNGSSIEVVYNNGTIGTENLETVYQEGMRQCFEQGGDTTNIVNYGEYIIIDTINKDNPDNGKIFRRGMNFDYDPINNPLAGAEYIGQVVGPKGSTAEIDIVSYKTATDYIPHQEREYTIETDNQGLVPGVNINRTVYEDKIHYAWTTIRDDAGNVDTYQIGFKFPYLIPEISGSWRKPYYTQEDYNLGRIDNPNLIGTVINYEDNFDLFIDNGENTDDRIPDHGDTGHPFYRKWKINIPKGIKGDSFSELKIFPTIVTKGSNVYPNVDDQGNLSGIPVELNEDIVIEISSYWDTFNKGYVTINLNGITYYARLTDTAELHYGCLLTWYDNYENGQYRWIDVGPYKNIDHIHLSQDGFLTIYYTSGQLDNTDVETVQEQVTWPSQVTLSQEGVLKFLYNNKLLDNAYPVPPADGTLDRNDGSYNFIMPWIKQVKLFNNGTFNFKFNNDRLYDSTDPDWDSLDHTLYKPVIAWIKDVQINENGTVTFIYCDDTPGVPHRFDASHKIKYLTDVSINTGVDEGEGNQKVHLTWNTIDSDTGEPEEKDIGRPLNYIVESLISIPNAAAPSAPYRHLLVYYSDPALRQSMRSKWVTYPSEKEPGIIRTEWVDLGTVKGENTGIHILKNVSSMDELKDEDENWIPPERVPDSSGVRVLNPEAAGWSCTLRDPETGNLYYLFYDYDSQEWYRGTAVDPSSIDPSYVIAKSAPDQNQQPIAGSADNLKENGFWFAVETGIAVS